MNSPTMPPSPSLDNFITRWASSGGAERANYALFLSELCALLDLPPPDPTRPDDEHRKRQQSLHPALTMTDMYNVLAQFRAGELLGAKEQLVHEQELLEALVALGQARGVGGRFGV